MSRIHIGRLLLNAFETFEGELVESLHRAGFGDIRTTDTWVLRNLDAEGTRVTELARRAQVTKQAMSQLVQSLEERGYVARRPDPDDGRARRVTLSEKGERLVTAAERGLEAIEESWSEALGGAGYRRLHELLSELVATRGAMPAFQDLLDRRRADPG